MEKYFLTEKEVAEDLGIQLSDAVLMVKNMNTMIEQDGYTLTLPHCINKKFYERAKAENFIIRAKRDEVPVEARLFWNLDEFVQMVPHAIGRSYAKKFLEDIGLLSTNGNKKIVNRIAFEEWCANNPRIEI